MIKKGYKEEVDAQVAECCAPMIIKNVNRGDYNAHFPIKTETGCITQHNNQYLHHHVV